MIIGVRRQNIIILFGNKEAAHCTVSFLRIHKWEPDIYIGFPPALHLQCMAGVQAKRQKELIELAFCLWKGLTYEYVATGSISGRIWLYRSPIVFLIKDNVAGGGGRGYGDAIPYFESWFFPEKNFYVRVKVILLLSYPLMGFTKAEGFSYCQDVFYGVNFK